MRATSCAVNVLVISPTPGIVCDSDAYLRRERVSAITMTSPARFRNSIEAAGPRHTRMKRNQQHEISSTIKSAWGACALHSDGRDCPPQAPNERNENLHRRILCTKARFLLVSSPLISRHARTSRCFVFQGEAVSGKNAVEVEGVTRVQRNCVFCS